ncbi:MAG: XRE family transcriptional regulator [Paludibacter sp.]
MNLQGYYQNLPEQIAPKTDFIREIAEKCEVGEPTVRLWVKGKTKPANPEHVKVISTVTGIPEEMLFSEDSEEV